MLIASWVVADCSPVNAPRRIIRRTGAQHGGTAPCRGQRAPARRMNVSDWNRWTQRCVRIPSGLVAAEFSVVCRRPVLSRHARQLNVSAHARSTGQGKSSSSGRAGPISTPGRPGGAGPSGVASPGLAYRAGRTSPDRSLATHSRVVSAGPSWTGSKRGVRPTS